LAELKTRRNRGSVKAFLESIAGEQRRKDCVTVLNIMKRATGDKPRMWGTAIVGFGDYHYKYASGREGDWFLTGFAPRKQDLTLYIMPGFERYAASVKDMAKLR
jgi:hypothetical protein